MYWESYFIRCFHNRPTQIQSRYTKPGPDLFTELNMASILNNTICILYPTDKYSGNLTMSSHCRNKDYLKEECLIILCSCDSYNKGVTPPDLSFNWVYIVSFLLLHFFSNLYLFIYSIIQYMIYLTSRFFNTHSHTLLLSYSLLFLLSNPLIPISTA